MQGLGGGGLVIAVAVAVVIAVAVCWRREHVGDQVQVSCEKGMGGPSFENCVQIIDFHSSGAWGETAWDHVRLGPWAHEHESMRPWAMGPYPEHSGWDGGAEGNALFIFLHPPWHR